MALYACDLPLAEGVRRRQTVERFNESTFSKEDYDLVAGLWNRTIQSDLMRERLKVGSEIWLARIDGRIAGYGWTLRGKSFEPYFFPLSSSDAHLFDFYVAPECRGRGVNVGLINSILETISHEGAKRALIECATWNEAQIRSLKKTPFVRYATVSKWTLRTKSILIWKRESRVS
jgi:GNAT superfamily N-acetyltransferase